jgi:glycosyltransferase involved in cell wall biosynthesis
MKILVLTALYPPHHLGGYELRCRDIVQALRQRGHTVEILTSNHRLPTVPPGGEEPGVERSLHVHGFFGHPWRNIRELRGLEFHNHAHLRAAIARFQPDVVHVWFMGGLSKSFIFALARMNVPVVYDVSDHWIARSLKADVWLDWWNRPHPSLPARCLRTAWTLAGRRAAWDRLAPTNPIRHARFPRIYFCSAALRDLTAQAGFPVAHGAVIHCPVNTVKFHGEPPPPDRPVKKFLYVGRVVADKGVMTALRALRELQGTFTGELTICGHGDPTYEAKIKQFAQEHHLPVRFTSATPEQIPEVYRQHDALLFTSEWEEPFALTPLEAMASGLPVIGTTTGGSRELLRHGENALTYTAGHAEELAQRIRELTADPALARRLAVTAQAGLSRLTEPVIVDQIEAYLAESIASWQPCPPPPFDAP